MRKTALKQSPAAAPSILPQIDQRIQAAQDMALSAVETDEVFAAGVDIGRLEALDFVTTVGTSALLSIYENLKKSKGWRHMRNPKSADGRHFESLAEFCEVKLGKSYSRFRELAANRTMIGQQAFEQAERIGLRQVDYNAIKALPAPDQELVRRAVEESKSRDEVLDLMQELAARHGAEKQTLTQRAEEAEAELKASEEVLAKKNARIDKLERDAKRFRNLPPDEALAALKKDATLVATEAEVIVLGGLRQALIALNNSGEERGQHGVFMAGLLGQVQAQINALREEFNLPDVSGADSAFDEGGRQAIREGLAQFRAKAGGAQ